MKFAEHLSAHITPEWQSQYISYDEMKDILYSLEQDAPHEEEDLSTLKDYVVQVDEQFFEKCQQELNKINNFFSEKLAEAQRKLETLKEELELPPTNAKGRLMSFVIVDPKKERKGSDDSNNPEKKDRKNITKLFIEKTQQRKIKKKHYRKLSDLKLAFSEFYLSLVLLQNYQTLNFTGFRKILKKHDKLFKTDSGKCWLKAHVETSIFFTNKVAEGLITEVEDLFIIHLEGGNRQNAMKRLRVPPFENRKQPWTTFRLGLYVGMISILVPLVVCLTSFLTKDGKLPFNWKVAIKLYRSSLFIILHIIFIGFNLYGWSTSGVNYVLIFEIDPRNHLCYENLLELGTLLGVLWLFNSIGFVISAYFEIEHYAYPFSFIVFLVLFLFNPFDIFYRDSRFWLLRVLFKILTAPFHAVGFADFWLADQLTSFEIMFSDIQYFMCWYLVEAEWAPFRKEDSSPCNPSDPRDLTNIFNIVTMTIVCVPAWFRFAQCLRRYRDTKNKFPHLANAVKYSTFFFDSAALILRNYYSKFYPKDWENPFFYFWIFVRLVSTSYKLAWDYKMDWGFFDKNAGENKYLREQIVYPAKSYYYFAIGQDFILRFFWLVRLYDMSLSRKTESYKEVVYTFIGLLEVFRRFVWNFFRLENEHLNNCGQFRAVRDISITPLKLNRAESNEKILDGSDDGKNDSEPKSPNGEVQIAPSFETPNADQRSTIRFRV